MSFESMSFTTNTNTNPSSMSMSTNPQLNSNSNSMNLGNGNVERIVHVVQVPSTPTIFSPWNIFVIISIALFFAYLYYSYTTAIAPKLEEKESPFVTTITSPEIATSILNNDGTTKIVLLHATWCEHCRVMMPAFNSAAESTRQIRWLKVEQTYAAPILKSRSDIRGFPTIFGVKSTGEIIQYGEREPRTEDSLKKWALSLVNVSNLVNASVHSSSSSQTQTVNASKFEKEKIVDVQNIQLNTVQISTSSGESKSDTNANESTSLEPNDKHDHSHSQNDQSTVLLNVNSS
jgi:thiol-disulfide isomerase/thioredoxin